MSSSHSINATRNSQGGGLVPRFCGFLCHIQIRKNEMTTEETAFDTYPRHYALGLVKDDYISDKQLALVLLKAMSNEDVRQALDANELSPRFTRVYL